MKTPRKLERNVWYQISTAINIGEPIFQLGWTATLLCRVLLDTKKLFKFEIRGLAIDKAWLTFYIKPANGLELPKIMQWLKQTFSLRFNLRTGRSGHLWGERYDSQIIDGDPPPDAKPLDWDTVKTEAAKEIPADGTYALSWDSPRQPEKRLNTRISLKNPAKSAHPPG
jgi:hypothetical protein